MASHPKSTYTPEVYLELDRRSEFKNEYFKGEIFAMTGASRKHNLITFNISVLLGPQLKSRQCEAYASDMRVKVKSSGLYSYPDVVVVCGAPIFEDKETDTLTNPTVIIEVLSRSTEGYDRGENLCTTENLAPCQNTYWSHKTRHTSSIFFANPIVSGFSRRQTAWKP
jgi:Uma2 family endonuclease